MSDHKPIEEEVLPWDCYYGECEHDDPDEHTVRMLVCDTCREEIEFEELESLVRWPCEHAESEPVSFRKSRVWPKVEL